MPRSSKQSSQKKNKEEPLDSQTPKLKLPVKNAPPSWFTSSFNGNSLVKDPDTGFYVMGKNYSIKGFNAQRKLTFIQVLSEFGSLHSACRVVGIHYNTFSNHYRVDPEFKRQVDYSLNEGRVKQRGEIELTILENAKKSSGFMDRMAWLRHNFPGEYDDKRVVTHTVSPELLNRLEGAANKVENANTNANTLEDKRDEKIGSNGDVIDVEMVE